MRAFVFTDKALARYAGRFVWLSIDTEDSKNAAFLRKFPIHVLPTLLVLDAKQQSVVMRYAGGATVPQLEKLLADGERAFRAHGNSADTLLSSADKLASEDKNAEAAKLYEKSIASAPKSWPRLGRAAESYTMTLTMSRESERCATAARDLYPRLKDTTSGANVAASGLSCALDIDAKNPSRAELVKTLESDTREAFDNPNVRSKMSGDDISGLYDTLISARVDAKDDASVKALREQWAAFLEKQAAEAKTPEQRAVYDSHRLSAYVALGTPEKAIPMLEQSEKDFPNDYNPPARLALVYRTMGRYDDALAATESALEKAYGPRKIGIYRTRADVFTAKGDKAAARKTIEEAIAYAKSLPEGQANPRTIAALEKKLTEMPQ